jgi:hypothetical protein
MDEMTRDQAVVLGVSMAGLLAARVLSERFERVVMIDRDPLPPAREHRQGVPHGRHLHGLHPRGREILDEFFPGFTGTLTAEGAVGGDILGDLRWQLSGRRSAKVRLVNAYLPRVHAAAAHDDVLAASLVRVIGLKDRPQTLLRPDRVLRVLRGNLAGSRVPTVASADQARTDSPAEQAAQPAP